MPQRRQRGRAAVSGFADAISRALAILAQNEFVTDRQEKQNELILGRQAEQAKLTADRTAALSQQNLLQDLVKAEGAGTSAPGLARAFSSGDPRQLEAAQRGGRFGRAFERVGTESESRTTPGSEVHQAASAGDLFEGKPMIQNILSSGPRVGASVQPTTAPPGPPGFVDQAPTSAEFATNLPESDPLTGKRRTDVFAGQLAESAPGSTLPPDFIASLPGDALAQISQTGHFNGAKANRDAVLQAEATLKGREATGGLTAEQVKAMDAIVLDTSRRPGMSDIQDLGRNFATINGLIQERGSIEGLTPDDQITILSSIARMRDPGNRVTEGEVAINKQVLSAIEEAFLAWEGLRTGRIPPLSDDQMRSIVDNARVLENASRQQFDSIVAIPRRLAVTTHGIPVERVDEVLSADAVFGVFSPDPVVRAQSRAIGPQDDAALLRLRGGG